MPKKDGTGPGSGGPMTGQGGGRCVIPLNNTEEELNYLKNRKQALRKQLQNVEARLKVLEALSCQSQR